MYTKKNVPEPTMSARRCRSTLNRTQEKLADVFATSRLGLRMGMRDHIVLMPLTLHGWSYSWDERDHFVPMSLSLDLDFRLGGKTRPLRTGGVFVTSFAAGLVAAFVCVLSSSCVCLSPRSCSCVLPSRVCLPHLCVCCHHACACHL